MTKNINFTSIFIKFQRKFVEKRRKNVKKTQNFHFFAPKIKIIIHKVVISINLLLKTLLYSNFIKFLQNFLKNS